MEARKSIELLIYIADNDVAASNHIKATVNELKTHFKQAIKLDIFTINIWKDDPEYVSRFICTHSSPLYKSCCYDKPLFKYDKEGLRSSLLSAQGGRSNDVARTQNVLFPEFLNNNYEAVRFSSKRLKANCYFIYSKKHRGVWNVVSDLLPHPEELLGEKTIISAVTSVNDSFIRRIDTSISQPLFRLSCFNY